MYNMNASSLTHLIAITMEPNEVEQAPAEEAKVEEAEVEESAPAEAPTV